MILSVSRRTDIPNYYSDWFYNRVKEGFLYVRNPINPRQISNISLTSDLVDCIVFWTKNPANMMARLNELQRYKYYFQFTLNGYEKDMEPNLPEKKALIEAFQSLSAQIGSEKVIWRYDPVLISEKYDLEYHLKTFAEIAGHLSGYTHKVVISFVDLYAKTKRNTKGLHVTAMNNNDIIELAGKMAGIAKNFHLSMETCAEQIDLSEVGINHGSCIDKCLIEQIIGCKLKINKDRSQRNNCGCYESIDVGIYHTCSSGCKYCYANFSQAKVKEAVQLYDVNSPLLCGKIEPADKITVRKVKTGKTGKTGKAADEEI